MAGMTQYHLSENQDNNQRSSAFLDGKDSHSLLCCTEDRTERR
jgi:hypothetical protein